MTSWQLKIILNGQKIGREGKGRLGREDHLVVYERLSVIHAKRDGMVSVERGNGTAPLCT